MNTILGQAVQGAALLGAVALCGLSNAQTSSATQVHLVERMPAHANDAQGTPFSSTTLSFHGLGSGARDFRIAGAQLTDAFGQPIAAVPEAATLARLSAGALALTGLAARTQRSPDMPHPA